MVVFNSFSDPRLIDQLTDQIIKFTNCELFSGDQLGFQKRDLWVLNGKIIDPKIVFYEWKRSADVIVDCQGLIISPGFIDIQVNGGFGIDFSSTSLNASSIAKVTEGLLQFGVTSFCPTVISSKSEIYKHFFNSVEQYSKSQLSKFSSEVLGAHLEGPFISREKNGCHPLENLVCGFSSNNIKADLASIYGKINADKVALVTIAPELPGALDAINYLANDLGIKVSVGHSNASLEIGMRAIKVGATCLTHLFNAMPAYHHRDPGLIGLLASNYAPNEVKQQPFYYGIIADGVHTDETALRLSHSLNFNGLILVTDCFAAMGLSDGLYQLGNVEVAVQGMKATVHNSTTIAGSVASMPYSIETFCRSVCCGLDEALQCVTLKPATFLGIENRKGCLKPGNDADLVFLSYNNGSLEVCATFISAVRRFLAKNWS